MTTLVSLDGIEYVVLDKISSGPAVIYQVLGRSVRDPRRPSIVDLGEVWDCSPYSRDEETLTVDLYGDPDLYMMRDLATFVAACERQTGRSVIVRDATGRE